jgi:hypothetical protein
MTTLTPHRQRWSDDAIARLEDSLSCPRCGAALNGRRCHRCGADYSGPIGGELWDASLAAVEALRMRQEVLDRVPTQVTDAAAPAPAPVVVPRVSAPSTPRSSATVQSVLAVAGAGLVAVAAIVFTFLNPDVTDPLARGLIVGGVTLVFLGGAAVLQRRRLRFSAEAVGALGVVFVGLDVRAVAVASVGSEWFVAAVATLAVGAALAGLALLLRLRAWLWSGVVALALVPAMLGVAMDAPILGFLGMAVQAFALLLLTTPFADRIGTTLRTERATLTTLQVLAIVVAVAQPVLFGGLPPEQLPAGVCGVLAASAVLSVLSTRHPGRRMWSFFGGGFGAAAVAVLPLTIGAPAGLWWWTAIPAAAVLGAITVAALAPMPRTIDPGYLAGGAIVVVAVTAAPPTLAAIALGASAVLRGDLYVTDDGGFSVVVCAALGALAAGLIAFGMLRERLRPSEPRPTPDPGTAPGSTDTLAVPVGMRWVAYLGVWYAGLTALTVLTIPMIAVWGRVALGLGAALLLSLAVARLAPLRATALFRRTAVRIPLTATAHVLVLFAAILSWRDLDLAVWAGAAVVVAVGALATTVPASVRFVHAGVGYAYALVVLATGLSLARLDDVAILCLTTSAGALVAIAATFARRVRVRDWYAVLAVTSVPFLLGVAQVVVVRSGWTALSTSLIFALALALVVTRRAGLVLPLRLAAAGVLVPALAVVIVCLGAQLLAGSGSPVVLPVIAVLVAVVLPSGPLVRAFLAPRIGARDAALVRIAVEATTLLTAAIAVGLALVRDAAGLGTSLIVLAVLGVAGAVTALWGDRRYGWWLAGAAFTGALWCGWGLAGVGLLEAYLLPPALAAALVGAVLTGARRPARELYAAGLGSAIVPLVAVTALAGPPSRALALVAAAWALAGAGAFLRGRLVPLRTVTLAAAIVAAAAGAVQGVRFGLGADLAPGGIPLIVTCAALALAGSGAAAVAARAIRSTRSAPGSRWLTAPAFAYLAVGAWAGIERDWFAIWSMWTLLLVLLGTVVVTAWRGVRGPTSLPPVWFVFVLAFATAVVAWSPRDLRVEWFSLPMGAALLAAGWIALRSTDQTDATARGIRSLSAWPAGFSGSWALLTPGLVVLLSASIAATFTDPLTWRAILVIVLALLAILVGATRRLAAPFVIGIIVLPVENVLVFLVQIGRRIEAMPWWITLAVVGAVLLIIAVTYERRAGEGIAARLRDLA